MNLEQYGLAVIVCFVLCCIWLQDALSINKVYEVPCEHIISENILLTC